MRTGILTKPDKPQSCFASLPQESDDWWRWNKLALPYRISRPIYMAGHLLTLSPRQLGIHRYTRTCRVWELVVKELGKGSGRGVWDVMWGSGFKVQGKPPSAGTRVRSVQSSTPQH